MRDLLFIALGLTGLFFGGNWLVRGASRIASSFGISALVIGLTVVALGTSMPEFVVSVSAALRESPDIAVGNVVGSNIANIGLILGLSGLITPLVVDLRIIRREIPAMIVVSVVTYLLALDGRLNQVEGAILVVGYLAYVYWLYSGAMRELAGDETSVEQHAREDVEAEVETSFGEPPKINRLLEVGFIVLGIVVLMIAAQLTLDGAVSLAEAAGVSELVIGLTLVAVGTSLPELVTSVVAAYRKHSDIAIGNVVGSNIANLLFILGMTAAISPVSVDDSMLGFDFLVMIGFAVLLLPFLLNLKLERLQAVGLMALYVAYALFAFAND